MDIDFADFALDMAFGAALGGLLGGGGGYFGGRAAMREETRLAELEVQRRANLPPFDAVPDSFLAATEKQIHIPALPDFDVVPDDFLSPNEYARRNIHGEDRQTLLNAFEASISDVVDGRAVGVGQVFHESAALGRAWDSVRAEIDAHSPAGEPGEVLVLLEPLGQGSMGVQRGPMAEVDGKIRATGRAVERQTGSRAGYGITKVQIDHPDVTRADIMSISRVMREYEPDLSHGAGRTWVVERNDGRQLVIGETNTKDGGMLATAHLVDP
jgi:hypothetical protein